MKSVSLPNITLGDIYKSVWPFLLAIVVALVLTSGVSAAVAVAAIANAHQMSNGTGAVARKRKEINHVD